MSWATTSSRDDNEASCAANCLSRSERDMGAGENQRRKERLREVKRMRRETRRDKDRDASQPETRGEKQAQVEQGGLGHGQGVSGSRDARRAARGLQERICRALHFQISRVML